MDVPRVGVLTDDLGLVVSLGLRHSGLEVERLAAPDDVGRHDAVIVDVSHDVDAVGLLEAIGDVPTVVLAGEGVTLPAGVAPVRRPCSLDQLLEAIDAVLSLPARVAAAEPVGAPAMASTAPVPAERLFTSHAPRVAPPGWSSQPPTASTAPGTVGASGVAELVGRLADADGRTLGASTVVTAAIAEQLVAALRDALQADHVALWTRHGNHHVVLAVTGGGPGAPDVRLPADHELVRAARASGGVHVRAATDPGSPSTLLVGVTSDVLGAVMVDGPAPVALVTVGARSIRADDLIQLQGVFGDAGSGQTA